MFDKRSKKIDWGGRPLTIETGGIARQADGAVLVTYGETQVLCTVVGAKSVKEEIDFFPLTVNYTEKAYAAGKIPGGFFKREGRPTEKETLVSRLIDRPIRPVFPDGFYNEVQVICNVLSHDMENDPDIPSIIGTSAARAWLIASKVCGLTPSSAATTKIATSVTFVPLARIAVNASWPGVSRKVSFLGWPECSIST